MGWIDDKIAEYYRWLKDNTAVRKDNGTGWFAVSTPFVGLFNDHIEIFVKKLSDTEILLSDDGETFANLSLSGVDFSRSSKRRECLQRIANNYGVQIDKDEIIVISNGADFAKKKHALVSAIMSISDMNLLANENIHSMFADDVMAYADSKGAIYTPTFIVRGKSGLDFNFDFQIAGKKSELVVKSFNALRQNSVGNFLFCLNDVKENRESITKKEFKSLAVINDVAFKPSPKLMDALYKYDTNVLLWSEKDKESNSGIFNVA